MPTEMLREFIGREVTICLEGEMSGFVCTIIAVEDNWMKVEEKAHIRILNGDMITQIRIKKAK